MKKTIALLLFLTAILTACGEKPLAFDDLYHLIPSVYIHTMPTHGTAVVPGKLNVRTGSVTPLCADPLCTHYPTVSACPFANMQETEGEVYQDGWYYFIRHPDYAPDNTTDRNRRLIRYHIETMRTEEVAVLPPDTSYSEAIIGETFYHKSEMEGASYRINIRTGDVLDYDPTAPVPFASYHGGFLYDDAENMALYYIDKQGNRTDIRIRSDISDARLCGDVLYFRENGSLCRYDLAEQRELSGVSLSFFYTYAVDGAGHIYYLKKIENPPFLGIDKNDRDAEKYNLSGGMVWCYDFDTEEERLLCTIPDEVLIGQYGEIPLIGGRLVLRYSTVDYDTVLSVEDTKFGPYYDYPTETGYILVDIETGDWITVPFDPNDGFVA